MGKRKQIATADIEALMRQASDKMVEYQTLLRAIVDCFHNSDTISDFANDMVEHIEAAEALLGGKPKQEEAVRMTTSISPYVTSAMWGGKK